MAADERRAFCSFGGLLSLFIVLLAICSCTYVHASHVEIVTDENFDDITTGDWMIEFYAPWCPACKQFASTWEDFAEWTVNEGNGIRVGKVDSTEQSGLSGQFMVTQLPTIFHIHESEVRPYSGNRGLLELKEYVSNMRWKKEEPLPWWRSPTAKHMKGLGVIYWLSQRGKELQTTLEEDYELPSYAVFVVVAIVTILIGLILGGITVCCIEVCIRICSRKKDTPPPRIPRKQPKQKYSPPREKDEEVPEPSDQTDMPQGEDIVTHNPTESSTESSEGKKTRKRRGKKSQGKKEQDQ